MFVRVRPPVDDAELEGLWAFRYATHLRDELPHSQYLDHTRGWLKDPLDEQARHLLAVDREGEIVGCLRSSVVEDTSFPSGLAKSLRIEQVVATLGGSRVTYSSRLMVEPSLRGRTIASLLVLAQMRENVRSGMVADLHGCESTLINAYCSLGYRPYSPPYSTAARTISTALILCTLDGSYLASTGSPFQRFVDDDLDDRGVAAESLATNCPDFAAPPFTRLGRRTLWAVLAAGPGGGPGNPQDRLFAGVPAAQLAELLGELPRRTYAVGERIPTRGAGEPFAGIVMSGRIGSHVVDNDDPHYITVLGAGDLIGEIPPIAHPGRDSYLTVLEEAVVMSLPSDLLVRLAEHSPQVGFEVANRLCKSLAHRLATADEIIARHMPVRGDAGTADSYHRKIGDVRELARLDRQASVMVDKEVALLRSLGLTDGHRVLDVGCGAGGLAIAVAKHLPAAEVLGIDPNPVMTERAEEARASAVAPNCRFELGNALALPLQEESQDFTFSRLVIQHLSAPDEAVGEIHRVLVPGGTAVLIDIDDGGMVVHPEPRGYARMMETVQAIKTDMGANRQVGRELPALLLRAGFDNPGLKVLPVTSKEVPTAALLSLAFDFRERLLREAGAWDEGMDACFAGLKALGGNPEALVFVPVFIAHAKK